MKANSYKDITWWSSCPTDKYELSRTTRFIGVSEVFPKQWWVLPDLSAYAWSNLYHWVQILWIEPDFCDDVAVFDGTAQGVVDILNIRISSCFSYLWFSPYTFVVVTDLSGNECIVIDNPYNTPLDSSIKWQDIRIVLAITWPWYIIGSGAWPDIYQFLNTEAWDTACLRHPQLLDTIVPTPKITYVWGTPLQWTFDIEVSYNNADRWILNYEPEIYLYMSKTSGWRKNHSVRNKRRRIAHMAKTDSLWQIISKKTIINPRLHASTSRVNQHDTEWDVVNSSDMKTPITISPFQFLWRVGWGTNGIGSFPILESNWNVSWTWSEYPATLSRRSSWDQNDRPNSDKIIVMYFKTVIRNPLDPRWFPIESDLSEALVIKPVNADTTRPWEYHTWSVRINK